MRSLRQAGLFQKSDERILGSGEFMQAVLTAAQESLDNRYVIAAGGIRFEDVAAIFHNDQKWHSPGCPLHLVK